jgi:hypothetical protein
MIESVYEIARGIKEAMIARKMCFEGLVVGLEAAAE